MDISKFKSIIFSVFNSVIAPPHIFEQPSESETAYKPGEDVRLPCVAGSDSTESKPR